jgi:hypothetical protein
MIAGAAVIALTTGVGKAAETPATAGGDAEAKAAPKQTEKELTDHEGYKLTLTLDDAGKVVKASAKDKQGKALGVVEHKMTDFSMCLPQKGKKPRCQTLQSMSDGASFRIGTATCRCQVYLGSLLCYGDSC